MSLLPPVVATLVADTKQFSGKMDEATAKMDKFGASSATSSGKFAAFASKASSAILGVGAVVAVTSIKMAGDFQMATTQLVTGAGEAQKNLEMVRKGILNMAPVVGQMPVDLAHGLYMIESAGFHGAAGLKVLKAAAEGATVGAAPMATVADAVTTALNDYHLPARKAAQVTSALVETVASGKTTLTDLGNSIGKVMPVAAALGISFQETAGAMATMTARGLNARFASQELKSLLLALSAPSKVAGKAMASVGLTTQQLKNDITDPRIGLAGALKIINDAIGRTLPANSVQAVTAFKDITGGVTGYSAAMMLSGQNTATFLNNVKNIGGVLGKSATQVQGFSQTQKDFNVQMDKLKATGGVLMIRLGDLLLPKATAVARWGLSVIDFFQAHPILSKRSADVAGALFAGALAVKVATVGVAIARSFGVAVEAGVAGTIGAAIGTAVLAVLLTGNQKQATTGVSQVAHGDWLSGLTNIVGSLDNTMRGVANFLTPGIHIGNIIQPKRLPIVGTSGNKKVTVVHRTKFGR